jgi:pyruvate kinase
MVTLSAAPGPLDFHRKSLHNLQLAMRKSRRLCCTMVDTLGRELMIRRQVHTSSKAYM